MSAASVLFVSATKEFNPEILVKQVLNVPELPSSCCVTENVHGYDWHIDNKYYTTDVKLCTTQETTISDQAFSESVEGFIIYFDPKQVESFKLVKSWLPYLEQIEPKIQMLVCENCSQDYAVNQLVAQLWCIEHGFELVELNPIEDCYADDDSDDDYVETTGVERILQCLHAHEWANHKLKEKPDFSSPYFKELMQEESNKTAENADTSAAGTSCDDDKINKTESDWEGWEFQSSGSENMTDFQKIESAIEACVGFDDVTKDLTKTAEAKTESPKKTVNMDRERMGAGDNTDMSASDNTDMSASDNTEISGFAAALGDDELGSESFEDLFNQLSTMKANALKLPPDARKLYAEQIALKFWEAIGGDEEEIEGLLDLDDPKPS